MYAACKNAVGLNKTLLLATLHVHECTCHRCPPSRFDREPPGTGTPPPDQENPPGTALTL